MLTAGMCKVCISPPLGAPLAGFAARQGVTTGIHDDLFARALVLENEGRSLALVSVDVLALTSDFVTRVRAAIEDRTGIGPEAIMIASTHTHAGPVTITTFFNPEECLDATYMNRLADAITQAVEVAWRERFVARAGVGTGHVTGVGVNRRSKDMKPVDGEIGIIRVDSVDGGLRAVFLNYACHPTVLGSNNLLVTGDFPAFAIERIERAIAREGPDGKENGFAMFVNGTQGNISMGHSSELSAIGVITPGRTFDRAEELGHRLGDAVLEVLPGIQTDSDPALAALSQSISLPLKNLPPVEEAERALQEAEARLTSLNGDDELSEELSRAKSERLYASINHFYARETGQLPDRLLPIELQGLRINDAAFIAIPAEVFVEIGLEVKRRAPHRTFNVGIANGYIGYLTTADAHKSGGYEVVSSKVAPEAERVLVDAALELEKQLFAI